MTSGRPAISIALSTYSTGVTQTGQPGPWTSVTPSGSSASMPKRTMAWVWPPQTSISVHGRVTVLRDRLGQAPGRSGSRYSSRNFMAASSSASSSVADLAQVGEDPRRLGLVDHGDGEADMDQHMVADRRLGHEGEVDLLDDAAEIDTSDPRQRIVAADAQDPSGNG